MKCADPQTLPYVFVANLVILLLWNASYAAMFDIAKTLHNPFGNRRIDVAHEAIGKGLRKLADALCTHGADHLPPELAGGGDGGGGAGGPSDVEEGMSSAVAAAGWKEQLARMKSAKV